MFGSLSSRHRLETVLEKNIRISADKNKHLQVLINLVSNAVKYSPAGGVVSMSAMKLEGHAVISIKNHGIGILEQDRKRIFGRFFRVQNKDMAKINGTGPGLSIVKYIIELHKCSIRVESEPGGGSTFIFKIHLKGR
jgi:signal transduction histidine kinase